MDEEQAQEVLAHVAEAQAVVAENRDYIKLVPGEAGGVMPKIKFKFVPGGVYLASAFAPKFLAALLARQLVVRCNAAGDTE